MAFTDPTDRKHEGRFSYSSCADERKFAWCSNDEDEDEDESDELRRCSRKLEDLPFDGLVPFFTKYAHPNLPIAVTHLMRQHGVHVTCSNTVIDDDDTYWTSGNVSGENYGSVARLTPSLLLTPIGHVEQLLSAGLACVYKNGARNRSSTNGATSHFYSIGYEEPDDIQVYFKFEGQKVCMQLTNGGGAPIIHMAAGSW